MVEHLIPCISTICKNKNHPTTVVLGARNRKRGDDAVRDIVRSTGNKEVYCILLDLLDLKSVRTFAEELGRKEKKVDILVNNAGIVDRPNAKARGSHLSRDKLEMVTQTNHLSPFLLTLLLKKQLAAAGRARVVNVSSHANTQGTVELDNINCEKEVPGAWQLYSNTKLMNVLFTRELAVRWADIGVSSYSLHPGMVRTAILTQIPGAMGSAINWGLSQLMGKTLEQGAHTSLLLSCAPVDELRNGSYYSDCRRVDEGWRLSTQAADKGLAEGLWRRSEELVRTKD